MASYTEASCIHTDPHGAGAAQAPRVRSLQAASISSQYRETGPTSLPPLGTCNSKGRASQHLASWGWVILKMSGFWVFSIPGSPASQKSSSLYSPGQERCRQPPPYRKLGTQSLRTDSLAARLPSALPNSGIPLLRTGRKSEPLRNSLDGAAGGSWSRFKIERDTFFVFPGEKTVSGAAEPGGDV